MTRATCPYCQNPYCPAIGQNRYLCPNCRRVYTRHPTSFESGVKATSTLFRIRMAKILEADE